MALSPPSTAGGKHVPELDLPGYDPLGPDGANINLVIGSDVVDPVSGAASLRASRCNIERLA